MAFEILLSLDLIATTLLRTLDSKEATVAELLDAFVS